MRDIFAVHACPHDDMCHRSHRRQWTYCNEITHPDMQLRRVIAQFLLVRHSADPRVRICALTMCLDDTLSLPAANQTFRRLDVNGEKITIDELGPVIITEDGKMRYIANWAQMSEQEQEMTQRRISKRNADRK